MWEFILSNWAEILLAVMTAAKVIVNLTPGITDDRVFAYLDLLISAVIANNSKKID